MSRIRNRQSSTSTTVKRPINKFIITGSLLLNAVLDNVRKTAVVQGSAADERSVHLRLAQQLARGRRLHAATTFDSHTPGTRLVEHRSQSLADEGVGGLPVLLLW